jgi:hypothetical protein
MVYPENEADEELNTDWIENFKLEENIYHEFYKEPVVVIKLFFMYVNGNNEIEHVHSDIYSFLEKGCIKRENILQLIKENQILHSLKYKLISLLRYNIDLAPDEIKDYLRDDNHADNLKRFIRGEQYLNDIYFDDTISMFQDLNALYFLYSEDKPAAPVSRATTNRLQHSTTKRIILNTKAPNRKTRRNLVNTNTTIKKT